VEEEMSELKIAIRNFESENNPGNAKELQKDIEDEYGDLIFSLINYARFLHVDAENALELTNKKFIQRFTQMETQALQNGKNLNDMSLQEMDVIWNSIKQQRKQQ
jgi:XTP/dITP diphosphohydrolase